MSPRFSIRPPATLPDRRLAELAARGDERAFETLIRRHRRELERYCRRLGLPDDRAEDVLQQSFTRAWMALRDGRAVGQPRPWLYRIVHNATLNAHRSARLRNHEPLDTVVPGTFARAATEDVESGMLARDALRQVAELPRMQRDAVVMTAIEGRSHEEAAGMLGVSGGAVRGLVHRARTRLRAAAAVMSPQGFAALLSRAPTDGAVEAGAGAGLGGMLAKGAAVAAVSGLAAGGAAIHLEHRRAARRDATPHARILAAVKPPRSILARPVPVATPAPPAVRARLHRAATPRIPRSRHRRARWHREDGAPVISAPVHARHEDGRPTLLADSSVPVGGRRDRETRSPSPGGGEAEATHDGADRQSRHGDFSAGETVEATARTDGSDGGRDGGGTQTSWSDRVEAPSAPESQPGAEAQLERSPG